MYIYIHETTPKFMEYGWTVLDSDSGVGHSWQGPSMFFLKTQTPAWASLEGTFILQIVNPSNRKDSEMRTHDGKPIFPPISPF